MADIIATDDNCLSIKLTEYEMGRLIEDKPIWFSENEIEKYKKIFIEPPIKEYVAKIEFSFPCSMNPYEAEDIIKKALTKLLVEHCEELKIELNKKYGSDIRIKYKRVKI